MKNIEGRDREWVETEQECDLGVAERQVPGTAGRNNGPANCQDHEPVKASLKLGGTFPLQPLAGRTALRSHKLGRASTALMFRPCRTTPTRPMPPPCATLPDRPVAVDSGRCALRHPPDDWGNGRQGQSRAGI